MSVSTACMLFLTRECDSNERVIAVSVRKIHSIDRSMPVNNSHCGGLSQSGARRSPYMKIHFESVDQLKCVRILGSSDVY